MPTNSREEKVEKLIFRHCELVEAIIKKFEKMFKHYIKDDKKFKDEAYEIHQLEHQADIIRREIQKNLYMGAYLSIYREDYVVLAELIDNIADKVESTADYIVWTRPDIPVFLFELFDDLIEMTKYCYKPLEKALKHFVEREFEDVLEHVNKIHKLESDIDRLEWRMINYLFKSQELDLAHKLLIKQLINNIADISDKVEDAIDRIEIMMVKRKI